MASSVVLCVRGCDPPSILKLYTFQIKAYFDGTGSRPPYSYLNLPDVNVFQILF